MIVRINLLPQKKTLKLPAIPWGTVIGIIVLGIQYYALFEYLDVMDQEEITRFEEDIKKAKQEKTRLIGDKQSKLAQIDQDINLIQQKTNLIKKLAGAEMIAWSEVFEDLTMLVPKKTVWLKSFASEGESKIVIQGVAAADPDSNDRKPKIASEVAKFMDELEHCPWQNYFSAVNLTNSQRTQMHGQDAYTFSISAKMDRTKRKKSEDGASGGGSEPSGDAVPAKAPDKESDKGGDKESDKGGDKPADKDAEKKDGGDKK